MEGTVEVTDLFKGAFLLCMGGRLDKVQVRNSGRGWHRQLVGGVAPATRGISSSKRDPTPSAKALNDDGLAKD
jgi:hypothetical protein